jgi:hypothetical protein
MISVMANPEEPNDLSQQLDEDWSPFRIMATVLHEMYESFIWSGFTDDQAIKLVALMAKENNDG